ncbi:hypothetical protein BH20ACT19_BH20ACT19_06020 [soil metagenome]
MHVRTGSSAATEVHNRPVRRLDSHITLAATDLTNHLACAHLTQQKLAIARGERGRARPAESPHTDLIRARGEEHQADQLARLSAAAGGHHVEVTSPHPPFSAEDLAHCIAARAQAMRDGAPLIFQAQLKRSGRRSSWRYR